jgi:hypothetical protein
MTYDRTTTISDLDVSALTTYSIQYVNGDLNLVHYWGSGYNAYVQDYFVSAGTETFVRTGGYYAIPLWSDTYQAVSIEYTVLMDGPFNIVTPRDEDQVLWEIRTSLTCEQGEVTAYDITSSPVEGMTRADLPEFTQNLVLAVEDFPLYTNPYTHRGYLGMIEACQTFFVTDLYQPRASITTYIHESITDHDVPLSSDDPLLDVPDDYGQPGAETIEGCE